MRILGIDPGLGRTGFGVVDVAGKAHATFVDAGCITTPENTEISGRLATLARDIEEVLTTHRPDVMAVEELYFAKNVTTGLAVAHARGVVLLQAGQRGIPIVSYAPTRVKQAVTSSGRATKQQVQEMVRVLLKLTTVPQPDDVADALAVALCHTYAVNTPTHEPT